MRTIVATAILLLVALLAALVVHIVLRRVLATVWARIERRVLAALSAAASEWLASEPEQMPERLRHMRRFPDQRLFARLCLQLLPRSGPGEHRRLIGWLEARGYIGRWIRDLGHRSPWRRARAAEQLGIARVPRAVEPLIGALADPVSDVRMRAARSLGALGGRRARQALVQALAEDNRWSVIRIADVLREMGDVVVAELIAAYPEFNRPARLAVLELLAGLGDASITPFLVAQLDDLDRDVRARAAAALGRIGDGRCLSALRTALHDGEWPVRAMACKALGELGTTSAIPELCPALRDREWWVRANAANALLRLGEPGRDALCEMLDDQDAFARDQALSSLQSCGELDRRLAGLCSRRASDVDAALRLLGHLETRHAQERLHNIRDRHPDPAVRRAIDAALDRALGVGAAS